MRRSSELGGWEVATTAPGACEDPAALERLEPAWDGAPAGDVDVDGRDWWFRTRLETEALAPGEQARLTFGGIATLSEAWLDGHAILSSDSMFARHTVDVSDRLHEGRHVLHLRCRALAPELAVRRRPRARWRTKLVTDGNLRWIRTTLLGRAPGFAPGPPVVGPYRPVRLERRAGVLLDDLRLRPRLEGEDGVLAVSGRVQGAAPAEVAVELEGPSGSAAGTLADGELRIPGAARWWPHTHGEPVLHDVRVLAGGEELAHRRVGFRTLGFGGPDPAEDGLAIAVNGAPVFARGAAWTPVPDAELRATLELARDAGLNLIRVVGTGSYETEAFHDLCDELGLLVWQDFMFANLDYPVADPGFRAQVEQEADQVLAGIAGRPSLAVLCGNSEVEQQVAMLGLDPALGRGELFGEVLPERVRASGADAVYLPSAPCGGERPFRPDRGVANYFGVGGYRRPLTDVRLAGVRFASECLAFANVGDADAGVPVHHPEWKRGVPRDHGSGWDFDDVRDHYLRLVHGVDPGELRRVDHERYLELSRSVSGEVMAEVMGEWRRAGSPCGGAIVLWLRDLAPGAGWGLIDHAGRAKVALHHLRRALAPVAVWTTDEGLGGMRVHVANDDRAPLAARLRLALYRDGEQPVGEAEHLLDVPAGEVVDRDVEALLGRFADVSWAYRFGPPAQDAVVATLEDSATGALRSQAFRFPAGPPTSPEDAERLGLSARFEDGGLVVRSRRLVHGLRVAVPGWLPDDDAFCLAPGGERRIGLRRDAREADAPEPARGSLTALNLRGRVVVGA